jgi:hypothetical protein
MKNILNFDKFLKESVFVTKEEVDTLLDKISLSGISSLSDIEKNRLTLFSTEDKEIIKTIEAMGDITNEFRELNQRMNKLSSEGKSEQAKSLMSYWMKLNDKLRPLEQSFRKWGIELGDERLYRLMKKVRPDAYNNNVIGDND